jgi:hypothetical protein
MSRDAHRIRNVKGEISCFIGKEEKEVLKDLVTHDLICDPERGGQAGKFLFANSENPATLLAEVEIFLAGIKEADPWDICNEA